MSSFSLNQELQEKLADKIFNSTNFAILSSIGLHAIILGGFFADFSNKNYKAATNPLTDVGLVKLTPLEQSRLLDFSDATTPAPSTPLVNTPSLPDASAIPSTDSTSSYPYPTTSVLPALPPFPSGQVYAPPSLPPYIPNQGIPSNQTFPIQNLPPLPPPPSNRFRTTFPPQVLTPPRPNFAPNRDYLSLDNLRRAPLSASEELRNQLRAAGNPNSEIARIPQPPSVPENNPSPSDIQQQRQEKLRAEMLQRSLVGDSSNTTNQEAQKNYIAWLNRVKNATPEPINLSGSYPPLACARQIEGTAVYGIVVDGNGAVNSPELIKSAGYPLLNNQALREITSRSFSNSTGQPKPYRVSVNYKPSPSDCPTATVTPPPAVDNPPVNTRVNPPLPVQPQPIQPQPSIKPQAPLNQTVKPQVPPIIPAPKKPTTPVETPTVPELRPPITPIIEPPPVPESRQPIEPPSPDIEPPAAAPASPQPTTSDIEPPAPPTSKKPDTPNLESLNPEN
jgi:TonB family protein